MALVPVRPPRLALVLLLPLAVACPGPNPPPADTTAPTTRAEPRGGSFNAPVSVTLSCSDGEGGSGCAATLYTTDGSQPTTTSSRYTEPLRLTATTTLRFASVDGAGNAEAVKTEQYTIDTTAPTVTAMPPGGTYNAAQTVTLSCSDGAGVGCGPIRYTTDGSTPTASSPAYSAPITVATSTTLRFFAADTLGNAAAAVAEQYVIDTTAPTVSASPAGGAYNAAQTVTLSCADAGGSGCAAIRYTTDGSDPTASSPAYTESLTISSDTTLKFFATDVAGNASGVETRSYFIDTAPPTTTASPSTGVFAAAQTVTLTCDDGTGIGCEGIRYAVNDFPDLDSPSFPGPVTFSVTLYGQNIVRFFSVDRFGRQEPLQTRFYFIGTEPSSISAQIAAVRAASDGAVSLNVDLGLVTYVKPAAGTEPAGFFVQAEQAGPALFIAVDPSTLGSRAPVGGERISFRVTQKTTVEGRVHVTAISNLTVLSYLEPAEPLRADVSNVDLPALLDSYEGELISLSGTLTGGVSAAANGFVTAPLSTTGAPSSPNLLLRVTEALQGQLNLRSGCSITVKSPLWRSNAQALVTTWRAEDLTVHSCP